MKFYNPILQSAFEEGDLIDNFTVHYCVHTGKKVVGRIEDDGEVVCLHNDDPEHDIIDVRNFYYCNQ